MNTIRKLQSYMDGRKLMLPMSLLLSAISSVAGMLPFIFIWLIIRELLKTDAVVSQELIYQYGYWAAGTAIIGVILYFLALSASHLAAFRVEINMRRLSMQKIVKMPLGFFDKQTSGKIRKIIDDNASTTHSFVAHQLPDLAGTVLMPLISVVLVIAFDWRLGLACLVPIISAMLIMGTMMGSKGKDFMEQYMNSLEDMNTEAIEYVRGIPVVKVFQQTIFSFKSFHKSIMNYRNMVVAYTKVWQKPMSAYIVIINAFAFFLVPVALLLIGNTTDYSSILLNLFFYLLLTPIFSSSIMKSMQLMRAMDQTNQALDRIDELTKTQNQETTTKPQRLSAYNIRFTEVSFTYPNAAKKAIDNISFEIPEGKTFALVGSSGSGKTTIARMVPRFWDAEQGEISIGNINVKEIEKQNLMQNVSFVFQNTKLFKTSLLENITYGKANATSEEIEKALEASQSTEIIKRLPDGLNTKIGTEGTYLSGGEQQRIALTRAILKNAPIVVLDEATAFADPENEHLIQKSLRKLTEGKTVLMIAHRLTSVQDVDTILVINEGKIAEQGTHNELLKKQGIYTKMWNEYQQSVQWTI